MTVNRVTLVLLVLPGLAASKAWAQSEFESGPAGNASLLGLGF